MTIEDGDLHLLRNLSPALQITAQIMYGMSKANKLSNEDIGIVEKQLKESGLTFE